MKKVIILVLAVILAMTGCATPQKSNSEKASDLYFLYQVKFGEVVQPMETMGLDQAVIDYLNREEISEKSSELLRLAEELEKLKNVSEESKSMHLTVKNNTAILYGMLNFAKTCKGLDKIPKENRVYCKVNIDLLKLSVLQEE